jgi:hypothetical protein
MTSRDRLAGETKAHALDSTREIGSTTIPRHDG